MMKNGNLQALSKDTYEKALGIWFQNTLKFDEHANYIVVDRPGLACCLVFMLYYPVYRYVCMLRCVLIIELQTDGQTFR